MITRAGERTTKAALQQRSGAVGHSSAEEARSVVSCVDDQKHQHDKYRHEHQNNHKISQSAWRGQKIWYPQRRNVVGKGESRHGKGEGGLHFLTAMLLRACFILFVESVPSCNEWIARSKDQQGFSVTCLVPE